MNRPGNTPAELIEQMAEAIGNTLHACGIFKAPAGDPWTDGPSILAARAAYAALPPPPVTEGADVPTAQR